MCGDMEEINVTDIKQSVDEVRYSQLDEQNKKLQKYKKCGENLPVQYGYILEMGNAKDQENVSS